MGHAINFHIVGRLGIVRFHFKRKSLFANLQFAFNNKISLGKKLAPMLGGHSLRTKQELGPHF